MLQAAQKPPTYPDPATGGPAGGVEVIEFIKSLLENGAAEPQHFFVLLKGKQNLWSSFIDDTEARSGEWGRLQDQSLKVWDKRLNVMTILNSCHMKMK